MDADPYAGDADHASFRSDDGEINVERDLKDRFEVQHVKTVSAGGKTETGPWKLRYEGAYDNADQIGRASGRARVGQYGKISVVSESLKKKNRKKRKKEQ